MKNTNLKLLMISSLLLGGCRASFENVDDKSLVTSADGLSGSGDGVAKLPVKDTSLETTKDITDDKKLIENCKGKVLVHEKGQDLNGDGVLQANEVTERSLECKTEGQGADGSKVPDAPQKPKPYPDKPHHRDDPNQNDSSQSN